MNVGRAFVALLATHTGVAVVAWFNGCVVGRFLARRAQEIDDLFDATIHHIDGFIDLVDPPEPYDWRVDGECLGADR